MNDHYQRANLCIKRTRAVVGICLLIVSDFTLAKPQLTQGEFENLFLATFTYMTVIKACGFTDLYRASDKAVNQTFRYGHENRLHNSTTERISQNINFYTAAGIDAYKKSAKVSCADARGYMQTIIQAIDQL